MHTVPLTATLGQLLTQEKFPALRSEALFVLALMGRSVDGGRVVVEVLEIAGAARALAMAVVGRDVSGEELGEDESTGTEEAKTEVDTGLIDGLGLEPQGEAKPSAGMAKVDRENGLVLVAEVLRGFSEDLSPDRKRLFERLLSAGGELMLAERNGQ